MSSNSHYNYDDAAYDELLRDANRDDRVGDHMFMVTSVERDQWPSGDPRLKLKGVLMSANNAKADLTISPPPAPEVVKAESKTWDSGKKKAIAGTVPLYRQLREHYGKSPDQIVEGDTFAVKTAKTRVDSSTGKGGFIRIIAFLNKETMSAAIKDAPPF